MMVTCITISHDEINKLNQRYLASQALTVNEAARPADLAAAKSALLAEFDPENVSLFASLIHGAAYNHLPVLIKLINFTQEESISSQREREQLANELLVVLNHLRLSNYDAPVSRTNLAGMPPSDPIISMLAKTIIALEDTKLELAELKNQITENFKLLRKEAIKLAMTDFKRGGIIVVTETQQAKSKAEFNLEFSEQAQAQLLDNELIELLQNYLQRNFHFTEAQKEVLPFICHQGSYPGFFGISFREYLKSSLPDSENEVMVETLKPRLFINHQNQPIKLVIPFDVILKDKNTEEEKHISIAVLTVALNQQQYQQQSFPLTFPGCFSPKHFEFDYYCTDKSISLNMPRETNYDVQVLKIIDCTISQRRILLEPNDMVTEQLLPTNEPMVEIQNTGITVPKRIIPPEQKNKLIAVLQDNGVELACTILLTLTAIAIFTYLPQLTVYAMLAGIAAVIFSLRPLVSCAATLFSLNGNENSSDHLLSPPTIPSRQPKISTPRDEEHPAKQAPLREGYSSPIKRETVPQSLAQPKHISNNHEILGHSNAPAI
jgi:hypothetical protein